MGINEWIRKGRSEGRTLTNARIRRLAGRTPRRASARHGQDAAKPTEAQLVAAQDYAAVVGVTLDVALAALTHSPKPKLRLPRGDAGTGGGASGPGKRVWKKVFFAAGRIGDGDGERALAGVSAGTGISKE